MKILLILRRFNPANPNTVGGVIVSSEMLAHWVNENGVSHVLVDTNKTRFRSSITAYFSILFQITRNIWRVNHVAMNLNERELIYIAPLVTMLCKLLRKSCSLRVFGGNLDSFVLERSRVTRALFMDTFNNIDIVFLQTKRLMRFYGDKPNITWLPTCRKRQTVRDKTNYRKRFVYIGQIRSEKGVREIIQAAKVLDSSFTIDFYGPLHDIQADEFDGSICKYRGMLPKESVTSAMSKYDVLLFPSYWRGEGYPGVLIEAFSVGIPVIATNTENISELVEHKSNGLLIPPKNVESLVEAIKYLCIDNYEKLAFRASESFQSYDCDRVNEDYIKNIKQITSIA